MSAIDAMNVPKTKKLSHPHTDEEIKAKLPSNLYVEMLEMMKEVNEGFTNSFEETVNSKYNIFSIGKAELSGDSGVRPYVQMVLDETEQVIREANFKDSTIGGRAVDCKGTIMVGGADRLRLSCLNFMFAMIEANLSTLPEDEEKLKKRIHAFSDDFRHFMWRQGYEKMKEPYYEFAYSSAYEMGMKIRFQPLGNIVFYVNKFLWMVKAANIIGDLVALRTRYIPTKKDFYNPNGVVSFLKTGQLKHAIFAVIEEKKLQFRFVCSRTGGAQCGEVSAETEVKLGVKTTVNVGENGELNWGDIKNASTLSIRSAFGEMPQADDFALNAGTIMASMWMSVKCSSKKPYLLKKEKIAHLNDAGFVDVTDENGNPLLVVETPRYVPNRQRGKKPFHPRA